MLEFPSPYEDLDPFLALKEVPFLKDPFLALKEPDVAEPPTEATEPPTLLILVLEIRLSAVTLAPMVILLEASVAASSIF